MAFSEQAREASRAYQKKWRAENKEKKAEYNRRYWDRVAEREKVKNSAEVRHGSE